MRRFVKRITGATPRMGPSVYQDLLRRVESAVTFDELRALRHFVQGRLDGDPRLAEFTEAVERRAQKMIAESELAAKKR